MGGCFVSSTLSRLPPVRVRPDPGWTMILEQAAIEVFEMMAGARLEPLPTSEEKAAGDRTAVVGMAGALCGMTTIRCSSAVAAKLAGRMLGGTAPTSPSTVGDALGELCYVVAARFKAKFPNLEDACMLAVPTVISGADYHLRVRGSTETFQSALKYEGDLVWISLTVHQ
jgi:CheY-specific phosphatase CheX